MAGFTYEFNKEELELMLQSVFLTNWIVNLGDAGADSDINDFSKKLFEKVYKAGFTELCVKDHEIGDYILAPKLREEMYDILDEYNDFQREIDEDFEEMEEKLSAK